MKIISSPSEINHLCNNLKLEGKTIGLVPTMGALHDGHLSLIKRAKKENEICIVSVFVNPTQFNNAKDLETYPRDLNKDATLLETVSCDYLFAPKADEIYSEEEKNTTFKFDFQGLDKVMEGPRRPGHFNGVVQIVSKLFTLIQPHKAYFGEKDFQQVAIIRLMTQTMKFDIEICPCPILRAENGLALSSRNELLTENEKQIATNIFRVLNESKTKTDKLSVKELINWVENELNAIQPLQVEYYEIVDGTTLQPISSWSETNDIVGCITVYCGNVRLIDNIRYK